LDVIVAAAANRTDPYQFERLSAVKQATS
jgi:hypothetical protein